MLTILVADDNQDAADTLAEVLRVLATKLKLRIGATTLPRLQRSWGGRVVVIAITGYGLPQDYDASINAGFDYHCTKPVTFKTVQSVLPVGDARV